MQCLTLCKSPGKLYCNIITPNSIEREAFKVTVSVFIFCFLASISSPEVEKLEVSPIFHLFFWQPGGAEAVSIKPDA